MNRTEPWGSTAQGSPVLFCPLTSRPGLSSGPPQSALPVQPTAEWEYCECNSFLCITCPTVLKHCTLNLLLSGQSVYLCSTDHHTCIIGICFTFSYVTVTQTTDFCFGLRNVIQNQERPKTFFFSSCEWSGSQNVHTVAIVTRHIPCQSHDNAHK